MGKLQCNSKLNFQSSSCKIVRFPWTQFLIMFGHCPSNFRNVPHHKQFKFSFKNTFKIHLYHLPNIPNIFNILYLTFQIYHITNHSQFFLKQIQDTPLPLIKENKKFQHFAFNFPNLTHHKPFNVFRRTIQDSFLPFTNQIKYFQHFAFNFPNLPYHKWLTKKF
jgi:hypothetical protein